MFPTLKALARSSLPTLSAFVLFWTFIPRVVPTRGLELAKRLRRVELSHYGT
jgi:hypothetical protein